MSILQLSVILIGLLSVLTAVAVVALIRQVGVLHLRIEPVAGVTGVGGPAAGSELQLPAALNELARRDAERFLVGFVSPTCGICGPVTAAFGRIAKTVNGSWRRGVPAKLGRRGCAGGHGPAFAATGVLPVRRPAP